MAKKFDNRPREDWDNPNWPDDWKYVAKGLMREGMRPDVARNLTDSMYLTITQAKGLEQTVAAMAAKEKALHA